MHLIYVDDEQPALDNFRLTIAGILNISSLKLFQTGEEAIEWAENHIVDVAFLDMEMPRIHGIALAMKLKEINENIRIIFVTAYSQYAMDAWNIDAIGYLMKPYIKADIEKELRKCQYRPLQSQKVVIQTIPDLVIKVEGEPLHIPGAKPKELLALLVDRGERGLTASEGVSFLWPERPNDANSQTLFRMTYKRLTDALELAGIGYILVSKGRRRYLQAAKVDCDLYRILSGDAVVAQNYNGIYLQNYSWAEERNGQLHRMLLK